MSKSIRLVCSIPGVIKAFVHQPKLKGGQVIRTPSSSGNGLSTANRRLMYTNGTYTWIIGFNIKPGQEIAIGWSIGAWRGRVMRAVQSMPGLKVHTCDYHVLPEQLTDEDVMRKYMSVLFRTMEAKAINGGVLQRDQVVAEWTRVCHAMGFGSMMDLPPVSIAKPLYRHSPY